MPKLLSQSEVKLEWADLERHKPRKRQSSSKRSSGHHLSGVIRYVLQSTGDLKQADIEDDMPVRVAFGMAWESWVVGLWPQIRWQPGEVCRDGVFGSPDGISEDQFGKKQLEEFKATWKSSYKRQGTDLLNERIWLWQLAGYCHMLGLTEARIHIFWVMGNYRGSGPVYSTYVIRFTPEELDLFWAHVILTNRDKAPMEVH